MQHRFQGTRILVTNDDGINAEGLGVLESIARELSDDVWVIAPEHEQSGAGHSLTMHEPLRYRKLAEKRYAVSGTPTDCVLMATMEICRDTKFGLVLSGVNRGANVAEDVTYSGTIAAAMEGTLLEIPSIAFSTRIDGDKPIEWAPVREKGASIVRELGKHHWPDGTLININFPGLPAASIKGIRLCPHGRRRINEKLDRRVDPRGRPYFWVAGPGVEPFDAHPEADYNQLEAGFITITPLTMDLTHHLYLRELASVWEQS